ncbi:hypothetical protein ACQKWADRAFT_320674 [Trichoderma austrokoningii]
MIRFISFLLIGLSALSSVAADCKSNAIQNKDVSGCICQGHLNLCSVSKPFCQTCGLDIEKRNTNSHSPVCAPGCTDNDAPCSGCGIWFSTLCNRIKDCLKGKACDASGKVEPNGKMVWMYLPGGDEPLITTTDLLPGILEMADHPTIYKDAFNFAQEPKHFDVERKALVLNSVRSRTMEQFHIHVCNRPTAGFPRALARLDTATLNPSKTLVEIPPKNKDDPRLWCMGVAQGKGPVTGFVEAIEELLHRGGKNPICRGRAGAAVIQDNKKRRWGCVTDNREGPLPYFCSGGGH